MPDNIGEAEVIWALVNDDGAVVNASPYPPDEKTPKYPDQWRWKKFVEASPPNTQQLVEALKAVLDWYDRDGSVGGAVEPMEVLREALGNQSPTQDNREIAEAFRPFLFHLPDCRVHSDGECTCGLDKILATLPPTQGDPKPGRMEAIRSIQDPMKQTLAEPAYIRPTQDTQQQGVSLRDIPSIQVEEGVTYFLPLDEKSTVCRYCHYNRDAHVDSKCPIKGGTLAGPTNKGQL